MSNFFKKIFLSESCISEWLLQLKNIWLITDKSYNYVETSQLISRASQLTGFYIKAILTFNELMFSISCVKYLWNVAHTIFSAWKGSQERHTYDIHENCPIFKTPTHLAQLCPKIFHNLHLVRQISNELPPPPSSPNDNLSIKRKHNPRMTIIYYQVFPSGRLSFSLILSGFTLTFFHLAKDNPSLEQF